MPSIDPSELLERGGEFDRHEEVGRFIDQAYLASGLSKTNHGPAKTVALIPQNQLSKLYYMMKVKRSKGISRFRRNVGCEQL
jgi:hypothetical protein